MGAILLKDISVDDVRKDILIQDGLIRRIEPAGSGSSWGLAGDIEIMDCSGKVAVPGFVNMHTHSPMSLMRGIGEDMIFQDWLARIWKVEDRLDKEYVYWATKVACLEMIRTGTTTFNDQYWFFDTSVQAAIYSVSEEMMLWTAEFAREHDLNLHIHLCETRKEVEDCKAAHGGLTPVEYLDRLGILSPRLLAAHTLWVTPHDIELLAAHGVNCIHNVNSNTKLASGYRFLYNEMRDAGINVCIGTDGCASSNNLDMLEAMKTSAIFQKAWRDDPSALPLDELLAMATVNGARALRFDGGRIAEGAVADINIVDTDNSFFLSPGPFLANLVYSAHSDCIDSVICNGKFLMRHREIPDEKEILTEARKVLAKIS